METGSENWGGSHYIECQVKIFSVFMHLNIENKASYYGDFMFIKKEMFKYNIFKWNSVKKN